MSPHKAYYNLQKKREISDIDHPDVLPQPPPTPPPPTPPPPPPSNCLLDIAIGCDLSGSTTWAVPGNWIAENDFVREFVTGLDALMDGSITGVTGSNDVQVGTYTWTAAISPQYNVVVRNMTNASSLIESDTNIQVLVPPVIGIPVPAVMGVAVGSGGDNYHTAVDMGLGVLNNFGVAGVGGSLGNRSSQPNYRRIMIIVTDATTVGNCNLLSSMAGSNYMQDNVWNVGSNVGSPELDIEVYALVVHSTPSPPSNWQGIVGCLTQNPTQFPVGNLDHGTGSALGALGASLASTICNGIPPCSVNPTHHCTDFNCFEIMYGPQYTVWNIVPPQVTEAMALAEINSYASQLAQYGSALGTALSVLNPLSPWYGLTTLCEIFAAGGLPLLDPITGIPTGVMWDPLHGDVDSCINCCGGIDTPTYSSGLANPYYGNYSTTTNPNLPFYVPITPAGFAAYLGSNPNGDMVSYLATQGVNNCGQW